MTNIDHRSEPYRPEAQKSTGALLSDALTHVSSLMRKEIDLARAELNQSITRAATAAGMIVGAVVVVLVALNVLSAAIVAGLERAGIPAGWGALIVGVTYLVIAFIMLRVGMNQLKAITLAPNRIADHVRKDAAAVKGADNAK